MSIALKRIREALNTATNNPYHALEVTLMSAVPFFSDQNLAMERSSHLLNEEGPLFIYNIMARLLNHIVGELILQLDPSWNKFYHEFGVTHYALVIKNDDSNPINLNYFRFDRGILSNLSVTSCKVTDCMIIFHSYEALNCFHHNNTADLSLCEVITLSKAFRRLKCLKNQNKREMPIENIESVFF